MPSGGTGMRHASCGMRHTACGMRHAACGSGVSRCDVGKLEVNSLLSVRHEQYFGFYRLACPARQVGSQAGHQPCQSPFVCSIFFACGQECCQQSFLCHSNHAFTFIHCFRSWVARLLLTRILESS